MSSSNARVVTVTLRDHLTSEQLASATASAESRLGDRADAPRALIIDALAMTGYDGAARATFVAWVKRHRPHLTAIAILTSNTLWYMVVSAMALAAGVPMKPFKSAPEADRWLAEALEP